MDKIPRLQRQPSNIRNMCIIAHVDHGKTTLADALIASNGIISHRYAGKLRYLDSRKDEQERGITMKSSAIALSFADGSQEYLVNLIDSPGHVDFVGEVSSAIQLCDGAIVVVDVVEGVCAQTKVAIQHAWAQNLKMIMVLNKIDRLITEIKFTPMDAYVHILQILEQVNAVVGELFAAKVLGKVTTVKESVHDDNADDEENKLVYDWSDGLEESDDSNLYFSPDQGNVLFASAIDGWGFGVQHFAKLYADKLGIKEDILLRTLWGDFYLNSKLKKIMKGAQGKSKKPLFVQFVLENIWAVYSAVFDRKDREMVEKITSSLNIKINARDSRHGDPRVQLQAIFNQWLPIANAVLGCVCKKLPSPLEISEERAEKLMTTKVREYSQLPEVTQNLKKCFRDCGSKEEDPIIVYISKMITVEKHLLSRFKHRPLTKEELSLRRDQARVNHAEKLANGAAQPDEGTYWSTSEEDSDKYAVKNDSSDAEYEFVAFARVFSGKIRTGQKLYVLGPKHDPIAALRKEDDGVIIDPTLTLEDLPSDQHVTVAEVGDLFVLMGRELEFVDEVPAGNILGIGGLGAHVLKCATLSSTLACPPFSDYSYASVPILRVAVESVQPSEMHCLVKGLKLLNQADASVQVLIQETGEHVIVTAGEVHLQRCLDDIRERFARIEINVSTPIVPFRETIIAPPTVDMVNEVIEPKETSNSSGSVTVKTANKVFSVTMRAVPLPESVTALIEKHDAMLKDFQKCAVETSESITTPLQNFKDSLREAFLKAGKDWDGAEERVWAFGPRRCGPNLLVSKMPHCNRMNFWSSIGSSGNTLGTDWESSFESGFQLATRAGPLCEEPLRGVCFVVEDWRLETLVQKDTQAQDPYGPFSGQVISVAREACRKAFQAQPQRLMAAMYSCNIQITADILGKMYGVLAKRHGRVLQEHMQEGCSTFNVTATLPVIESFHFANEIRKQTSGLAMPQLVFSHWEVIDTDPFWVPHTAEEIMLFGERADSENRALRYMNAVRRRKGQPIDEKIVEHAEKQRTLSKNK